VTDKNVKIARASSKVVSPGELIAFVESKLLPTTASGRTLAFLMVDLRRSDRLSTLVGDPSSQKLSDTILDRLDSLLRADDRIAAVTFDEIWLVLPDLSHPHLAVLAANRILDDRELRDASLVGGTRIHPCIGIACFPNHSTDLRELIEAADVARRAAAVSEYRYSVFQPAQAGPMSEPQFQTELRNAINANALELHYQPQIDLQSGECRSAEALIRWTRTGGEPVPATLIAEAVERSDNLHSFTVFVMNTALRHMVGFQRNGPHIRLSVNLSAMLVADNELPGLIAQLLEAWGVQPALLTLEVTERSIVKDIRRSTDVLKSLKDLGIRLAMDDFGTGYSSLAHLKLFPFDEIKIDQLFVNNMLLSQGDLRIVHAMIDLGHTFGMEVVAEGVEDLATLNRLKELNCDLAQGYVIARPMSVEAFGEWWGSRQNLPVER
jgi:EAL domain-containing protein (putative c-di-GMP-specific phosphodiesterase class I)/GGDEF domain-containing protein